MLSGAFLGNKGVQPIAPNSANESATKPVKVVKPSELPVIITPPSTQAMLAVAAE
jgi:hypothetical protein